MFDEIISLDFEVYKDDRGIYSPYYLPDKYEIPVPLVEDAFSLSNKGVLRGFHQEHDSRGRAVFCIQGSVQDAVLRLSDMKVETAVLTPGMGLFIPNKFAHAFLALEDNTILMYKFEKIYRNGYSIPPSSVKVKWLLDRHDIISISKKDLFGENFT